MTYKNWRCFSYVVTGSFEERQYSYDELKEYFDINDSEIAVCIKQFDLYRIGDVCQVLEGPFENPSAGFIITNAEVLKRSSYTVCYELTGGVTIPAITEGEATKLFDSIKEFELYENANPVQITSIFVTTDEKNKRKEILL